MAGHFLASGSAHAWVSFAPNGDTRVAAAEAVTDTALPVAIFCAPWSQGLGFRIDADRLRQAYPAFGEEDEVLVSVEDQTYRIPLGAGEGGDPFQVSARWSGQVNLLDALLSGSALRLLVAPSGDRDRARDVGGIAGTFGAAPIAAVRRECGLGSESKVYSASLSDADPATRWSGDWILGNVDRRLNTVIARAVASNVAQSLALFCDSNSRPSGYVIDLAARGRANPSVVFQAGDTVFEYRARSWDGMLLFPLTDDFVRAIVDGEEVSGGIEGDRPALFATVGARDAVAFSLGRCLKIAALQP